MGPKPDRDGYTVPIAHVEDLQAVTECWHAMLLKAGLGDEQLVNNWRDVLTTVLAARLRASLTRGP